MNKGRRKRIAGINDTISNALENLRECYDEECDTRDNMPENLQSSERYEISSSACDCMEEAIDHIESAIYLIQEIK